MEITPCYVNDNYVIAVRSIHFFRKPSDNNSRLIDKSESITYISGLPTINSYSGELLAPFRLFCYVKEIDEIIRFRKTPLPGNVQYRAFNIDVDRRISGIDWKADLYYSAAHLRRLIDRIKGQERYHGMLTISDVEKIAAAYNGSGPNAVKYGKDAIRTLLAAGSGSKVLYFYEK